MTCVHRFLIATALAICAGVFSACASDGTNEPHAGVRPIWRGFERLGPSRALALAGDPERVWVGAAVGDAPSQAAADATALEECLRRRIAARIQEPCRLYAQGSEIVWDPFGTRRDDSESLD